MIDQHVFQSAADGVDPARVPQRRLPSGAMLPMIGLGTFGSDHVSPDEVAAAVRGALEVGYRHIDCAAVYGNEAEIGAALQSALASGLVRRKELWVTSKLWNDMHAPQDVIPAFRQTLANLRLDYLDLYLIHWPFPNHHPAGCDVHVRSPHARPYIHADYMRTWQELEKLVDMGLVRHIGTSNMTIPKMNLLLRDARIRPVVNQLELHPHLQQRELFDHLNAQGIVPVGYCPLGSPGRPERDRTPADTVDMEDPVIVSIARRLGVHPSAVCLKWAVQRGQVAIPFSSKRRNYLGNLQAVVGETLTPADMQAIAGIDRNCRLVKGHVFLWKDGQTWEDLWDFDGRVTPA